MKNRILILIATMAVAMFGAITTAIAQGKSIYFMKDGNAVYNSTITNVDSIIFIPTPKLSVNSSTLSFSAKATESRNVVVTTNQPSWDVSSDQPWCAVTKGTDQFTVTATANTVAEERTATVTVSAGYAPDVTIAVTQAPVEPNIAFVGRNPVVEYLYATNGYFLGSRINFALIVYDAAEKTSITIQEKVSFGAWNANPREISQTRIIPISGPGTYVLSQEMMLDNGYGADWCQFVYTVSVYGKSYSQSYSSLGVTYNGTWSHNFGMK